MISLGRRGLFLRAAFRLHSRSSALLPVVPIPGVIRGGRGTSLPMSAPAITAKHRELRSDFLIDKAISNQWQPFRDVFEVDGVPIRDREQRFAKVFFDTKDDAAAPAKPIARKALAAVRVIEFVEKWRPTLVTGRPGEAMPAFGRIWLATETGRIVRAEARIDRKDVKAILTTEFRLDEHLGITVPIEMHERYELVDKYRHRRGDLFALPAVWRGSQGGRRVTDVRTVISTAPRTVPQSQRRALTRDISNEVIKNGKFLTSVLHQR